MVCDSGWHTVSGKVAGWVGNETVEIELSVDSARRLGLAIGQEAVVRAAWLRFPSFTLEPLELLYRCIDATTYRYESAGGRFVTELHVNAAGFVTYYPNFRQVEVAA